MKEKHRPQDGENHSRFGPDAVLEAGVQVRRLDMPRPFQRSCGDYNRRPQDHDSNFVPTMRFPEIQALESSLQMAFPRQEEIDQAPQVPEQDDQQDANQAVRVRQPAVVDAMDQRPDPDAQQDEPDQQEKHNEPTQASAT
jgi:hypothetical protein